MKRKLGIRMVAARLRGYCHRDSGRSRLEGMQIGKLGDLAAFPLNNQKYRKAIIRSLKWESATLELRCAFVEELNYPPDSSCTACHRKFDKGI
ncbi:MAG: hypothetical protein ACLVHQ_06955 [Oscillospiraceae bacterium]